MSFEDRLKRTENGCLEWQGARLPKGYGAFRTKGKRWYVHRYAWTVAYGDIPAGEQVCHACDNPPCCEPTHLFLGTQHDNLADMSAKGRSLRGTRSPSHKLRDEDVLTIRQFLAAGTPAKYIVRVYRISDVTVSDIRNRRTWRHLP